MVLESRSLIVVQEIQVKKCHGGSRNPDDSLLVCYLSRIQNFHCGSRNPGDSLVDCHLLNFGT